MKRRRRPTRRVIYLRDQRTFGGHVKAGIGAGCGCMIAGFAALFFILCLLMAM